ncbi:MAG: DMT family transporter [Anaerolineae bacterium]
MGNLAILIIIAVIGGVAVTLQAQMTGLMNQSLGTLESVFITYTGGGVLIAFLLLALRGGNLAAWQSVPWYALSAGALGLVIIGTISYSVPRLGLVAAFTILVATQFITGAVLDHFGLLGAAVRPFDLARLVGVGALLAGAWLIIR